MAQGSSRPSMRGVAEPAGCDDVAVAELHSPSVAVVRRDNAALGRAAAELLLRRLRGDDEPAELVLPTEFVARPSCGPARR